MDPKLKLAGLIVFLGFAYAGYEFFCFYTEEVPQLVQQRQALEDDFNAKQTKYQSLRAFVQNIESIKGELRELSLQLKTALEYMPPDFKLSELLRRLTGLAQNSGVELVQFTPDAAEERPEGAFYATVKINFEVRGAFTQCLLFFDQISRLKRIINVVSINLDPTVNAAGTEERANRFGSTKIRASGTMVTFRFAE
jgi:Tfp pilus assembly protein PilO